MALREIVDFQSWLIVAMSVHYETAISTTATSSQWNEFLKKFKESLGICMDQVSSELSAIQAFAIVKRRLSILNRLPARFNEQDKRELLGSPITSEFLFDDVVLVAINERAEKRITQEALHRAALSGAFCVV